MRDPTWYGARLMPPPGKLGAGSAMAAYVALLFGMLVIGAPAQQRGIVSGLWITEALAIALPAAFVLGFAGIQFAPWLGLRRLSLRHALVAAAVAAVNQPVVSFLTWIAHNVLPRGVVEDFDAKQRMLDTVFRMNAMPMLITVTLAAPLGEELFFRGFALPALRRTWGPLAALVVSGALFSLLHMDAVGFIGLMEIGMLLGALRWWSGSLWAAMIGHAVNNGIAGGAFLLGWEDPDVPPPAWVLALGATLFILGLWELARLLRRSVPDDAEEIAGGPGRGAAAALGLAWVVAVIWGLQVVFALRS
ncbi:MAG: CPBP family intramembrane metalloprotease [Deltaproteobacteria bacterium]|nr:MAG: CPBP family intramembrane metalloprotease [Deltaproteobacteria bacterium]